MKFVLICALLTLFVLEGNAGKIPDKKKNPCASCSDDYKPVCGVSTSTKKYISFGNECVLKYQNCEHKTDYVKEADDKKCKGAPVRLS